MSKQPPAITYYAVARLTSFSSELPHFPVELQLPAGCAGVFLVFETLEAALEWAGEDGVEALRPVKVLAAAEEP